MQHDRIRLRHMLDAGNEALPFALGRERTDLEGDRMLRHKGDILNFSTLIPHFFFLTTRLLRPINFSIFRHGSSLHPRICTASSPP
jgi:hypothetical protein